MDQKGITGMIVLAFVIAGAILIANWLSKKIAVA